jgi:CBS domain-containing protein
MQVKDIMTVGVDFCKPEDNLKTAADRMRDHNVGILPVMEEGKPVGMITDRDIIIRAIAEGRDPFNTRVSDIMTHDAFFCIEDMEVEEAAKIMEYKKVRRLLVKNSEHQVSGVLSLGDIAMSMTKELAGEVLQEVTGLAYPER